MHDFLECLSPGPESLPAGQFAMWLPTADESKFSGSATEANLTQLYQSVSGIATFVVADLLRHLGIIPEDTRRVALPKESASFPLSIANERVVILSLSKEKGIRFHFHESIQPAQRNEFLSDFISYLAFRRRSIELAQAPFDDATQMESVQWWNAMKQTVQDIESRGEPVEAVGKMLMG